MADCCELDLQTVRDAVRVGVEPQLQPQGQQHTATRTSHAKTHVYNNKHLCTCTRTERPRRRQHASGTSEFQNNTDMTDTQTNETGASDSRTASKLQTRRAFAFVEDSLFGLLCVQSFRPKYAAFRSKHTR